MKGDSGFTARTTPGEALAALERGYRAAAAATGSESICQFNLAGHLVELRFSSAGLKDALTPALQHANVRWNGTPTPDLVVRAWTSADSGVAPPAMPWRAEDMASVARRTESLPRLYLRSGDVRFLSTQPHNLLAYVQNHREAVFWLRDPADLLQWEKAAPMRLLLQLYFSTTGIELVHAAAVGDERGLVLLTGPSGSGKSTTSLLCLKHGFGLCSDDYCAVDCRDQPICYSLYSSAKLVPESFEMVGRFSAEQACYSPAESAKGVLYLASAAPECLLTQAPVRAVVACEVSDCERSVLRDVEGGPVLRALAPSSLFQGPVDMQKSLTAMARLVRRSRTCKLELGRDFDRIPDLVRKLLNGHCP